MRDEAIAVVGIGSILPGGSNVSNSWQMIVEGRSEIREVPKSHWDADLYYDPDPRAPYRTNSKIGSFLPLDIGFNPKEFSMPPILKDHLDPTQQLALLAAREALQDCQATDRTPRNWAVSVGNLLGGSWKRGEQWIRTQHVKTEHQLRQSRVFQQLAPSDQKELMDAIELQLTWSNQPRMTPDSLPGLLGNLIASRIAHYYNLTGPNFTIDAACATSLAAIEQAVLGLRAHRYDAAIAGGVDRIMDASSFIGFSKMGVLSPDGSRPFDAGANGFVMGEGAVLFVLKRYADAVAANDKIYGVILGLGSSTDGQGRAIAAPNPEGQRFAVERAYIDAQVDPATIDMIECHGTSTPIGDPTEIAGLRHVWQRSHRKRPVAIGSIKSNLGHLKGAAGAAAMLKAIMALHHRVLPPQINFHTPNPHCEFEATPFRVQTQAEPWEVEAGSVRRCGVSAFGFGGINYHVVLEEAPMSSARTFSAPGQAFGGATSSGSGLAATLPLDLPIVALSADSEKALAAQARDVANAIGNGEKISDYIKQTYPVATGEWRVALHVDDTAEGAKLLNQLADALDGGKSLKKLEAKGVFVRSGTPLQGKVAFMFPGQGSQYVNMMSQFKDAFPIIAETLAEADEIMKPLLPKPLSEYMIPPPEVDEGTAFMELLQTEVLQPAVLAADTALWRLLGPLLPADLVMGHSLGEYGAAIAADVFSFGDALRIVAARGEAIAAVADHLDDNGVMIGVGTDADTVEALLAEEDQGYVIVANKNCPTQTIIAGATEPTMAAAKRIEEKGIDTIQLPVSHAFHSSIVSPASPFLLENLKKIDIRAPKTTILSNVTAEAYPTDDNAPDWIRETLSVHLARPVEWQKMVELAYDQGFRYFIEVGPKRALSSFVKNILEGKPHCSVFSAHPKFGEVNSLGRMLAQLVAEGLLPYGGKAKPIAAAEPQTFPPLGGASQTVVTNAFPPPAAAIAPPTQAAVPAAPAAPAAPQHPAPQPAPAPMPPRHWAPSMPLPPAPAFSPFADPGFWQFMMHNGGMYFQHMVEQYRQFQVAQHYHMQMQMASMYSMAYASQYAPPAYAPPAYAPPMPPAYAPGTPFAPAPPAPPAFAPEAAPAFPPAAPAFPPAALPAAPAQAAPAAPTMVNMPAFSAPAPVETAAYIATQPAVPAASQGTDLNDLAGTIVNIVADRTGYTTDELGLDEHLEADLGIDSIRQVEVMAEVRDLFQLPRDDNFNVSDYTTLRALINYVERMRTGGDRPGATASSNDEGGVSG